MHKTKIVRGEFHTQRHFVECRTYCNLPSCTQDWSKDSSVEHWFLLVELQAGSGHLGCKS